MPIVPDDGREDNTDYRERADDSDLDRWVEETYQRLFEEAMPQGERMAA